ncbi:MAG: PIN domain-containing protein [Eggerthellaceae bacterium]|nr:PIN domain-containing protein [Eggerthellaceae bacterium]
MRLMLDTNVALDFMLARHPHFTSARNLMMLGYVQEIELWMSGAQINDLLYVLTKGGKPTHNDAAKQALKKLRRCVQVYRVGEQEIDAALESTWEDLEDACLYQAALNLKADFIITRNSQDFSRSSIRALSADAFFEHLAESEGLAYEIAEFPQG